MTMATDEQEQRLTFDYALEAPPEKVWRALTIPAYLDRWLGPVAASGGGFARRPDGLAQSVEAEVIEAEPPRRLSWRWREAGEPAGTISFTLTPDEDGGTLLRLVHIRQARTVALPPAANSNFGPVMLAA
jgi:uncharacterized protein YndB with AHSA1/START domain